MPGVSLLRRVLMLVAMLGSVALSIAAPAWASPPDSVSPSDAIIAVREDHLAALLDSGFVGEHTLVSAAELGLEEAALAGLDVLAAEAVLPPGQAGRDTPEQRVFPFGVSPFFAGFTTVNVRIGVPVVIFRPTPVPVVVPPAPLFAHVRVVVLPPPVPPPVLAPLPPPVLAPPLAPPLPPAPAAVCCPPARPAAHFPAVPIIPEADSLALLGGGLLVLGLLVGVRTWRRRVP